MFNFFISWWEDLCLLKYSLMKKIKRIVAKANVTIAFFTHLHIVRIRDDKNVMKITNSKKISVLLKIVRIL